MIHRTTGVRGHEGTKYLLVRVTSSNILKANQITLATLVAFYRLKAADSLTSRQKVQAGDCCERAIYLLKMIVLRYYNMEMHWAYHINIDRSFSKWKMGARGSELRNKYCETSEMGAWRHTKVTQGYVLLIICLLSNTVMTHSSDIMVKCALYPYSYSLAISFEYRYGMIWNGLHLQIIDIKMLCITLKFAWL